MKRQAVGRSLRNFKDQVKECGSYPRDSGKPLKHSEQNSARLNITLAVKGAKLEMQAAR